MKNFITSLAALFAAFCAMAQTTQLSPNVRSIRFDNTAQTGISTAKTYTHLLDCGTSANTAHSFAVLDPVVNGVQFTSVVGTSGSAVINGNTYAWSGLPATLYYNATVGNYNFANISTPDTEEIYNLLRFINYGTANGSMVFTNLTPGVMYEARFYSRAWNATGDRRQHFTFKPDAADPAFDEYVAINPDAVRGDLIYAFRYVAGADGKLTVGYRSFDSGRTFHMYAFSNEEVGAGTQFQIFQPASVDNGATTLRGRLTDPPAPGTVTLFWGGADKGETAAGWDNEEPATGTFAATSLFSQAITGLEADAAYAARFRFAYAGGELWTPVVTFTHPNGWLQATAGPHDFNNTANWAAGDINGLWSPGLELLASQIVNTSQDIALDRLDFLYNGGADLRLRGSGGRRTLTLGGDITHNTAHARRIDIGQVGDAAQALDVDFANTPSTLTVAPSRNLRFGNAWLNVASLLFTGGGNVYVDGNEVSQPAGAAAVEGHTYLEFNTDRGGGAQRLGELRLLSGYCAVLGNTANDTTNRFGRIVSDNNGFPGINELRITPRAGRQTVVAAGEIARDNDAVMQISAANLGQAPGSNVSNILLDNPPALSGEGWFPGTVTNAIIPWMFSANSGSSFLLTYDPATGLRPLDTATEYDVYPDGYSGPFTNANANVKLGAVPSAGATIHHTGAPATLNSIFSEMYRFNTMTLTSAVPIRVASGALVMGRIGDIVGGFHINAPLDFTGVRATLGVRGVNFNNRLAGDRGAAKTGGPSP